MYIYVYYFYVSAPPVTIEDMNIAGNLAQPLLDNSHLKLRSHLAQNAAVAKRRPPSKVPSSAVSKYFNLYGNIVNKMDPTIEFFKKPLNEVS